MSAGQRRRLSLEHVLAARRRQLPRERRRARRSSRRTTAATTRCSRRASSGRRCRRSRRRSTSRSTRPATGPTSCRSSSNANLRIDPDFKSPYSDQFIVQFEQEVMREPRPAGELRAQDAARTTAPGRTSPASVRAGAVHRQSQGIDATGQTVMVYRLLSNPADRVFLQTNPDGMYMRYNGVTMMATKRMSQQLAGRDLAGAVESRRPARLERAVHARRTSQSSRHGGARSVARRPDRTTSSTPTAG